MENPYTSPKSKLGSDISDKNISLGKWLAIAFAFCIALYIVWYERESLRWEYLLGAALYVIAGIGLFFDKSWSQYIYYLFAVGDIGLWLYEISLIARWLAEGLPESLIGLIPGILFVIVNIGIVVIVYKHLNKT